MKLTLGKIIITVILTAFGLIGCTGTEQEASVQSSPTFSLEQVVSAPTTTPYPTPVGEVQVTISDLTRTGPFQVTPFLTPTLDPQATDFVPEREGLVCDEPLSLIGIDPDTHHWEVRQKGFHRTDILLDSRYGFCAGAWFGLTPFESEMRMVAGYGISLENGETLFSWVMVADDQNPGGAHPIYAEIIQVQEVSEPSDLIFEITGN